MTACSCRPLLQAAALQSQPYLTQLASPPVSATCTTAHKLSRAHLDLGPLGPARALGRAARGWRAARSLVHARDDGVAQVLQLLELVLVLLHLRGEGAGGVGWGSVRGGRGGEGMAPSLLLPCSSSAQSSSHHHLTAPHC